MLPFSTVCKSEEKNAFITPDSLSLLSAGIV
jgi:hypothetical protein